MLYNMHPCLDKPVILIILTYWFSKYMNIHAIFKNANIINFDYYILNCVFFYI